MKTQQKQKIVKKPKGIFKGQYQETKRVTDLLPPKDSVFLNSHL